MELTILMPCLNEEKTIAYCIDEASSFLLKTGISGEILVADNGSCDKSVTIARKKGARVILVQQKGYGATLRKGIAAAKGRYVIFADCDMSYNFFDCYQIYQRLIQGNALVVGNRFNRYMEKGAMPFSHQYIGVPLLSFIGRKKYGVNIKDFHCGLRGLDKNMMQYVSLQTTGMEFATELIAVFAKAKLPICQVNIRFRKDMRNGKSHIRTIRDGMRHLIYMLIN
ncbi:MAG: glycosyltransferase family 2 protein [Lachnospiraceae bacterium]